MKMIYLFCLLHLCANRLTGQVAETFIVDSVHLSIKQTLPFDRPFILAFRGAGSKSIYSAFLFEWEVKGNTRSFRSKKDHPGNLIHQHIKPEQVFITNSGADVFIPAQPPSKNFAILLAHRFDGDLLDEVLQASWLLHTRASASAVLKGLNSKVKAMVKAVPGIPIVSLHDVSAFAYQWLQPPVAVKVAGVTDVGASIANGYQQFHAAKLQPLYTAMLLSTTRPAALTSGNIVKVIQTVSTAKLSSTEFGPLLTVFSRDLEKSFMEGTVALSKEVMSSIVKEHQLSARIKNLNVSLSEVEKLSQYAELLQAQMQSPILSQLITDLKTLQGDLEKNRDMLKEGTGKILDELSKETNLIYNTWAFGHNEVWDLKTRGSYQLIPDIGVATIFGTGNEKNEVIVRPYVGASIYFRPVDKGVPFNYFDKKYRFLHRFSANLGVTVGKLDQGEFSDFFNSMNLLIGGNYKITREFSFSTGVSFLKRKNANHGIEDKTTVLCPYLGLSFDLDFTSSIQKVTGKFSL